MHILWWDEHTVRGKGKVRARVKVGFRLVSLQLVVGVDERSYVLRSTHAPPVNTCAPCQHVIREAKEW